MLLSNLLTISKYMKNIIHTIEKNKNIGFIKNKSFTTCKSRKHYYFCNENFIRKLLYLVCTYLEYPLGWQACNAAGLASSSSTSVVLKPAARTLTSMLKQKSRGSRCFMRNLPNNVDTTSHALVPQVTDNVLYSISGRRHRAYTFIVVCGQYIKLKSIYINEDPKCLPAELQMNLLKKISTLKFHSHEYYADGVLNVNADK